MSAADAIGHPMAFRFISLFSVKARAVRIVVFYAGFATLWIYASDTLLAQIADPASLAELAKYKGLFFVAVTSLLLHMVLRNVPLEAAAGEESIRLRLWEPLAAGASVLAVGMIAVLVYRAEDSALRQGVFDHLEATAEARGQAISDWLASRQHSLEAIARSASDASAEPLHRVTIDRTMEAARDIFGFVAIALVDADGHLLAGSADAKPDTVMLQRIAAMSGRVDGQAPQVTTLIDLHRQADGQTHFGAIAPVRGLLVPPRRAGDPSGAPATSGAPVQAFVIGEWLPDLPFFQRMAGGDRSRTLLMRTVDGRLETLFARSQAFLPGGDEEAGEDSPEAIFAATGHRRIEAQDGGGTGILAAAARLPVPGWFVLTEIDENTALAGLRHLAVAAAVSVAVAFGASLALGLFLWQRQRLGVVLSDLARQREAQAAEDRYRVTFDQVPVGIVQIRAGGRFGRCNRAFYEITGISPEDLETETPLGLVHPDERSAVAASVSMLFSGERQVMSAERRLLRPDGSTVIVAITATSARDAKSGERTVIATLQDITARRRAEDALRARQERFDLAMRGANDGVWDWNLVTGTIYYSPRWKAMLGYGEDEIEDRIESHDALLHPDDRQAAHDQTAAIFDGRRDSYACEFRMRAKNGEWRHILSRAFVVRGAAGEPIRMVGTHVDLTKQKRDEEALRQAAAVFSNTQEGVMITDPNGRIIDVNPAFTVITGWSRAEAVGRSVSILNSGLQDKAFYEALWWEINENGHWQGEIWNRRRSGEVYPQWLTISTVRDAQGRPVRRIGTFIDIGKLKTSEAHLAFLANHDVLTGLPNRATLMNAIGQSLGNAAAYQSGGAVLFFDLDRFKTVNDSLGHAVGDELIVAVANRLKEGLPIGAVLARLGGDEFVAVIHGVTDRDAIGVQAEQWRRQLDQPFTLAGGRSLYVTVSIGVAVFPGDGDHATDLLQHADAALYAAKAAGGDTVRFYTGDLTEAASARLDTEIGLRRAIDNGEFELYYQPLVGTADGRVRGVEALIRWRHPVHGLMEPGRFLAIADETGLVLPIGEWVLPEACRQLQAWREAGVALDLVAVNLTPREFKRSDIVERVAAALSAAGLPARCLELEITEGALLDHGEGLDRRLAELKALGVRLAIDDFGTGYSSLAYLSQLPIDKLKIDKSFVRKLTEDDTSREIVRTIVGLAHNLGIVALAEGVETAAQLDLLQAMGCEYVQGYYFSRPVPNRDIPLMLGADTTAVDRAPQASAEVPAVPVEIAGGPAEARGCQSASL